MLKPIRKNKNSKSINGDKFVAENSNFKSGSIQISTKQRTLISLNKLNEIAKIPEKDEQFRIITRKAINSFDFILAVLAEKGRIDEMFIAFYRIGKKVAIELNELQKKNKIGKITFLINDGFPKLVPDAYNTIKQLESEKWEVKLENNHTKIIGMKCNEDFLIVEGSGNLSINARIEQYVFDNNEEIYNFHKKWINEI